MSGKILAHVAEKCLGGVLGHNAPDDSNAGSSNSINAGRGDIVSLNVGESNLRNDLFELVRRHTILGQCIIFHDVQIRAFSRLLQFEL